MRTSLSWVMRATGAGPQPLPPPAGHPMQGPTCTTVHGPCPSQRHDGAQEQREHYLWFLEEEVILLTTICDPGEQRSSTLGGELTSQGPTARAFQARPGPDSASCPRPTCLGLRMWLPSSRTEKARLPCVHTRISTPEAGDYLGRC